MEIVEIGTIGYDKITTDLDPFESSLSLDGIMVDKGENNWPVMATHEGDLRGFVPKKVLYDGERIPLRCHVRVVEKPRYKRAT